MHWLFEWCNQSQSLRTGMITLVFYSSSLLSECDEVLSFCLDESCKMSRAGFLKSIVSEIASTIYFMLMMLLGNKAQVIFHLKIKTCHLFSHSILHKENEACFRIFYIVTFIFLSICIYCTFNSPDSHFQWWFWFLYLNQHQGSTTNTLIIYKYLIYHYFFMPIMRIVERNVLNCQ